MTVSLNAKHRKIQKDSSQALFAQLEEILREGIEDGTWGPGEPIPSERELSRIHELSRMTVRRAIDRLVTAGLLYRVDGKGTFVSEPKVSFQALTLAGLREQTVKMGFSPSAKLLGIDRILAPEKVATVLGIKPDSPVFLIERLVYGNEVPLALLRSHIPVHLCPGLIDTDLSNASLYAALRDEFGISIRKASETLETTLASTRESLLMGVDSGSPMFLLRITTFDDQARPIEFVKVVFRGDRVQLSLDL